MSYIQSDGDNIYLNVVFSPIPGQDLTPAIYNVTKSQPIIQNPKEYYCSVIRFDIPLNLIPLYIMPIIPNQANPNLTPMQITISFQGTDFTESLIYVSDNLFASAPTQNLPDVQVITPYYYVYSFQNLIDSLNTALSTAYAAFGVAFPAAPQVIANSIPYFVFDPQTQLISLIVDNSWATTGANEALITVNSFLNNYLLAFRYKINANASFTANAEFSFVIEDKGNNICNAEGFYDIAVPANNNHLKFTQEYSNMNYWISLRKILVTSSSIPVLNEYVPGFNSTGTQNSSAASQPILTDFVPQIQNSQDSRSIAYYVPTSQYRLLDMISSQPLKDLNLQLFWVSKAGGIYPIYISNMQEASIKIAFLKKSLYKRNALEK